jgi:hypothetical protein
VSNKQQVYETEGESSAEKSPTHPIQEALPEAKKEEEPTLWKK